MPRANISDLGEPPSSISQRGPTVEINPRGGRTSAPNDEDGYRGFTGQGYNWAGPGLAYGSMQPNGQRLQYPTYSFWQGGANPGWVAVARDAGGNLGGGQTAPSGAGYDTEGGWGGVNDIGLGSWGSPQPSGGIPLIKTPPLAEG